MRIKMMLAAALLAVGLAAQSAAQRAPAVVFSRMMDRAVRQRDPNGQAHKLLDHADWASLSPDGRYIAHWNVEATQMHLCAIEDGSDWVVDTLPGVIMREMVWSSDSKAFAYNVGKSNLPGVRVFDLAKGVASIIGGRFTMIAPAPQPGYFLGITDEIVRVNMANGERLPTVGIKDNLFEVQYSPKGDFVAAIVADKSPPAASDDEPDCSTGTHAVILQRPGAQKPTRIPFPAGFDDAKEFDISPDGTMLAITFGTEGCDYPGDVARVYKVDLRDLKLEPLSPEGKWSVKPRWAPDGKSVVYSDYGGSEDGALYQVDVSTRRIVRLTDPKGDGPDTVIGWR